jgi:hypothetical protein
MRVPSELLFVGLQSIDPEKETVLIGNRHESVM